jgi:putative salt-induced outer membrane protein YdiY
MHRTFVAVAASLVLGLAAAHARADEPAPGETTPAPPPPPPPATDVVTLESGDKLTGRVLSRTEAELVLEHPVLGKLTIPAARVKQATNAAGEPFAVAPPAPPPAPPEPEWKISGEVGVNGTEGNVDNQDLRAAVEALYESPHHRWRFNAGWMKSETEDVKTKEQGYVAGLKDFLYPGSPWFWFLGARMDWDDFQIWDSRFTGAAGVGYTIHDTETFKLRARAGATYVREFNVDETAFPDYEDDRYEALLGGEAFWKITDAQTLEARATWFPDLEESGEYRIVASLAYAINLSKSGSLALKVGLEDEYDSHRVDPAEENDFKYFIALLFRF